METIPGSMADLKAKCLSRLQRMCSKAEYCTADIRRKALRSLDGDSEAADEVVAALIADKYVDDRRYASAFAREKASLQGWGTVKIRFQLRGKGISEEAISAALDDVDPDGAEKKLDKILAAKARTLEGDPQFRLKMLKFGLSRGYEYPEVEASLERLKNNS